MLIFSFSYIYTKHFAIKTLAEDSQLLYAGAFIIYYFRKCRQPALSKSYVDMRI